MPPNVKPILYALVGALTATLWTTTAAFAGSGVGGVFNLGQVNTVDAQTVLNGNPGANPELKVVNNGSGAAIRGETNSGDPISAGVLGKNNGGGPGLKATVSAGAPPLAVNSSVKVPNLNADLLDGLDSAGLWKLSGNAGTTPGANFLGTTDNQALELKVNGQRALRIEPDATSPNLIGGFSGNAVINGAVGATIAGGGLSGSHNLVSDNQGTVGGGIHNVAGDQDAGGDPLSAERATVSGGYYNIASGTNSTVGGGGPNTASGDASTVGGGVVNTASGLSSTVAGGNQNMASGDASTVGGGESNTAGGGGSTVAGGLSNTASDNQNATVGGGWLNTASGLAPPSLAVTTTRQAAAHPPWRVGTTTRPAAGELRRRHAGQGDAGRRVRLGRQHVRRSHLAGSQHLHRARLGRDLARDDFEPRDHGGSLHRHLDWGISLERGRVDERLRPGAQARPPRAEDEGSCSTRWRGCRSRAGATRRKSPPSATSARWRRTSTRPSG